MRASDVVLVPAAPRVRARGVGVLGLRHAGRGDDVVPNDVDRTRGHRFLVGERDPQVWADAVEVTLDSEHATVMSNAAVLLARRYSGVRPPSPSPT